MKTLFDTPSGRAKREGVLHFDGACWPNPGPAQAAFILVVGTRRIERTIALGHGTNNIAEYEALIAGMEAALAEGVTHLEAYGDSMLVIRGVRSMKPRPNGAPHLKALKAKAQRLACQFDHAEFRWIPRSENAEADALSMRAFGQ